MKKTRTGLFQLLYLMNKIPLIMLILNIDLIVANEPPGLFSFNQSSQQAFYFIISAEVGGASITNEDWIGAFKNNVCVGSILWAGSYTPVPVMGDDGNVWSEGYMLTGEVPEFYIWDASNEMIIHAVSSNDFPWANNGLFNIQTLPVELLNVAPVRFTLQTNPNPFNGKTNIRINSDKQYDIELTVFDINGRWVEIIYSDRIFPGEVNLEWDAGNKPSGVYFIRLKNFGFSIGEPTGMITQKLLLLK